MAEEREKRSNLARNREESDRSGDKVGASRRHARSGPRCSQRVYDEHSPPWRSRERGCVHSRQRGSGAGYSLEDLLRQVRPAVEARRY